MVTLDDAADELYAAHPTGFVNQREALMKQARADGDRALANQIKALRRPTVAAWVVNTVVRQQVPPLTELLELGGRLRTAQAMLDAPAIKELSSRRQELEREVVKQAVAEFRALGEDLGQSTVVEIEGTLRAAVADPAAAAAVASGRLTRALSYAGFGEVDLTAATATPVVARKEQSTSEPEAPIEVEPNTGEPDSPEARATVVEFPGKRRAAAPADPEGAGTPPPESHAAAAQLAEPDPDDDEPTAEDEDEEFAEAQRLLEEAQRRVAVAAARRDLANARRSIRTATLRAEKAAKQREQAATLVADLEEQLATARARLEAAETEAEEASTQLAEAQRLVNAAEAAGEPADGSR